MICPRCERVIALLVLYSTSTQNMAQIPNVFVPTKRVPSSWPKGVERCRALLYSRKLQLQPQLILQLELELELELEIELNLEFEIELNLFEIELELEQDGGERADAPAGADEPHGQAGEIARPERRVGVPAHGGVGSRHPRRTGKRCLSTQTSRKSGVE